MTTRKDLKILFVEDEVLIALETSATLRRLGFSDIDQAHTLKKARQFVKQKDYDLAILDVNLSGKNSLAFAEQLAGSGVQLIFTSGYDYADTMFEGFDAPVVKKPYTAEKLKDAIQSACSGSQ